MLQLLVLTGLISLATPAARAAPVVTQRPMFRIDGTERVLFIYTGNLIITVVSFVVLARILVACFGLCCIGNQERFYYREVMSHVFSLSEMDKTQREPVDSLVSAMHYAQEFLQDREARCLATLGASNFKMPPSDPLALTD